MEQYNLNRFIKAQNECFEIVVEELKNGRKESHWMWYMFPQIQGLGKSGTSVYYSIKDINEAKAYLENEVLRERLLYLVDILVNLNENDALQIFGSPDDLKFWSSMTLFNQADPEEPLFKKALDKFFKGKLDANTMGLLALYS